MPVARNRPPQVSSEHADSDHGLSDSNSALSAKENKSKEPYFKFSEGVSEEGKSSNNKKKDSEGSSQRRRSMNMTFGVQLSPPKEDKRSIKSVISHSSDAMIADPK